MIKLSLVLLGIWLGSVALAQETMTVEQQEREVALELEHFEQSLTLRERREIGPISWQRRSTLSPSLRKKYLLWHELLEEHEKWTKAIDLRQDLLKLYPNESERTAAVHAEADRISQEVIKILYHYRKEWGMLNTALLHNTFIKMNWKKKGYCWHWVEKFLETLRPIGFAHFDLHWGVAYEQKFRENNALVITRQGADFAEGLAIDAWRSSGRPFWRPVSQDRFPWVKRDESQIEFEIVEN